MKLKKKMMSTISSARDYFSVKKIEPKPYKKIFNKKDIFFLIIILVFFLTLRLKILYTNPNLFDSEECFVGTISNELYSNENVGIFDISRLFNAGSIHNGRMIEGIIGSIMFSIFGVSGITFKYGFIFIGISLSMLVFFFLCRFFGRREAFTGLLITGFGFPLLTLSSLSQGGPHLSGALIDVILLYLLFEVLHSKNFKPVLTAAFGILSGLAIWYTYYTVVMVFIVGLFLVMNKGFFSKEVKRYGFFFILGLIPILFSIINYGINHVAIYKINAVLRFVSFPFIFFERIFNFIITIPNSFALSFLHYNLGSELFIKILFSLVFFAPLLIFKKKRNDTRPIIFFLITYVVIYFLFFNVTELKYPTDILYQFRHFLTVAYLVTVVLSIRLSINLKRKSYELVRNVFLVSIFLISVYLNYGLIWSESDNVYTPYCYSSMSYRMMTRPNGYIQETVLDICDEVDIKNKFDCLQGLKIILIAEKEEFIRVCENNEEYSDFCETIPFEDIKYQEDVTDLQSKEVKARILGSTSIFSEIGQEMSDGRKISILMNHYSGVYGDEYHNYTFEECLKSDISDEECVLIHAYRLSNSLGIDYLDSENILCNRLSDQNKRYCYFSLGTRIGEIYYFDSEQGYNECRKIDSDYYDYCLEGVCATRNIYGADVEEIYCP